VFVEGFSNGGFLAHSIACELSDKVAAIGAVSGVLGISTCNPTRAIPVIDVHGTGDFVIPFNGGGVNNNISVPATIAGWVARNGCTGTPTNVYSHGNASCAMTSGCTDGADVELCTISDGGHQWPGGRDLGILNGLYSSDLDATDAIWAFFAAHPKP
jgi:polyhydroxybutyrate depolymerase